MEKLVFYGRTEAEIEDRFVNWQEATDGSARNIKRHPIKRLPLKVTPRSFPHQKIESLEAFSMLVEYERER